MFFERAHLSVPHWIGCIKGGRMFSFKDCDAFSVGWVYGCLSVMSPAYF